MTTRSDNENREKLLSTLESLRRKIDTGEMTGMVVIATGDDDTFSAWRVGTLPGPSAILLMRDYSDKAMRLHLDQVAEEGAADRPWLTTVESDDAGSDGA